LQFASPEFIFIHQIVMMYTFLLNNCQFYSSMLTEVDCQSQIYFTSDVEAD